MKREFRPQANTFEYEVDGAKAPPPPSKREMELDPSNSVDPNVPTNRITVQRYFRIIVHARSTALLIDRKSTRLNSSHLVISYAVFCLKKKTIAPTCQRSILR